MRLRRRKPLEPEPWRPREGDRVFVRTSATPHEVRLVMGDRVLLANVDLPDTRCEVPASWVRPVAIFPARRTARRRS